MGELRRDSQLALLKSKTFDVLVIGGGATGAGVVLDAVSRGLSAACVEQGDFASGTSSRSTKLIHGGVRYLERAVLDLDRGQYALVKEALHERAILLRLAPHLTRYLPLLTPLYHRKDVPYYYAGLKMYDWLAGDQETPPSRYVSAKEALKHCPMLQEKNLRGGVIYYDGQFDDARMALSIILRAVDLGAVAINHLKVTDFVRVNGTLKGVKVEDRQTGATFEVRARALINAAGPTADHIRLLAQPSLKPLLKASSGVHIVLDSRFSSPDMGLLIPKTEDGRLLFLLPWLRHTLVGTTDNPAEPVLDPQPSAPDIAYILRQLRHYVGTAITEKDILARWSGLRPLVQNHPGVATAKISREHAVEVLACGLLTIVGGKWTTYRRMAMDVVDEAIAQAGLKPKDHCLTDQIYLAGGAAYDATYAQALHEEKGWDLETCRHLNHSYGDRAKHVVEIAGSGYSKRLIPHQPYLEAEVVYGALYEMAQSSIDVLSRRLRLGFLNAEQALAALPRVSELLSHAHGWSPAQAARDLNEAQLVLRHQTN